MRITWKTPGICAAILCLSAASGFAAPLPTGAGSETVRVADDLRADVEAAVERGLKLLAASQNGDGSFGKGGRFGTSSDNRVLASTAVAGTAFLASGSTLENGPYREQIAQCLKWMDRRIEVLSGRNAHYFALGYAALFYGELCRITNDETLQTDLKGKIQKIVQVMAEGQRKDGGWYYNGPTSGSKAITAINGTAMLAVQAMEESGMSMLDRTMLQNSDEYIRGRGLADGGYRYGLRDCDPNRKYAPDKQAFLQEHMGSNISRSAACLYGLMVSGSATKEELEPGLQYLWNNHPDIHTEHTYHYPFGFHFVTLAMQRLGKAHFDAWYPVMARDLLARRRTEGNWSDYNNLMEFQTGLALILLQIPEGNLPVSSKTYDYAERVNLGQLEKIRDRTPEPERLQTALKEAEHENREYRARAMTQLSNLRAEEAVPRLAEGCKSDDPIVAYFAARGLKKFGEKARPGVPALIDLLDDFRINTHTLGYSSSLVADGALAALSAISGEDFGYDEIEEHLEISKKSQNDVKGMMNVPEVWDKRKTAIRRCLEWYRERSGKYGLEEQDVTTVVANVEKTDLAPYPGGKPPKFGVSLDTRSTGGARITAIFPNSVASRSGIRAKDIIVEWDGKKVGNARELIALVKTVDADEKEMEERKIPFTVQRDGEEVELSADFSPPRTGSTENNAE